MTKTKKIELLRDFEEGEYERHYGENAPTMNCLITDNLGHLNDSVLVDATKLLRDMFISKDTPCDEDEYKERAYKFFLSLSETYYSEVKANAGQTETYYEAA